MQTRMTNRNLGAELRAMSRVLRDVHRSLIDFSRERYELVNGVAVTRADLLRLLLTDDAFTWLRPLSRLIADIDELSGSDEPSESDRVAIGGRVAALMSSSDDPNTFGSRYIGLLASEPRVAMSHGDLRAAVALLTRA